MKKFIILFFSFFLVGCQNYRELNNTAIVSALGIDKKNNDYVLTTQIINTEKNGDEQNNLNTPIIYTGNGNNISDALNDISLKSPKMLYLGHLDVVVISENIASNNISEITDYFLRNEHINKNFTILVSNGNNPEEILNTPTPLVNFPSGNILGSLEISSTIGGASSNVKFLSFVDTFKKIGKNPVMSSISLINNKEEIKKELQIDDLGIFNNNKLVGYLSKEDTKGYNFITNNIDNSVINLECENNNYISVNVSNNKTKIKVTFESNKPVINLNINADGKIIENSCNSSLNKIKTKTEKEIKNMIENSIKKVKTKYKSDIFGFGNYVYLSKPNYFNEIKNKWDDEMFISLKVNTNVNITFSNTDNLLID